MEGAIAELDSAKVRHKTHGLNYITLLKAGGDKYVYYKRSVIMASIMLAYYALARLRFARFLGYSAKALGGMAVTQLFYSRYPEIIIASQDALLLNVDAVSAPREAPLPTIQIRRGMRKVLLLTEAEKCSAGGAAIRFKENVSGLRRIFYLAAKVAEAVAAKGDYLAPSPEFIRQYEFLLSWLMHAKPVLYLDNVAYSSGTTKWQFLSNAVKTALLTLVYAIVLPFSILKVATVAYPPKVGNMRHNLEKFREYLQRMDAERKQPAKPLR